MANNDHYISRFLTRPWERSKNRHLRYFDFDRRVFETKRTEKLFRARRLNHPDTETFLSKVIEAPCARFQKRLSAVISSEAAQVVFNEAPIAALSGLFWYQSQRLEDVRRKREGGDAGLLDDLAGKGEAWLNQMTAAICEQFRPTLLFTGDDAPVFFPECAYVPIPIFGTAPVLALPMTPRWMLAFVNHATDKDQFHAAIAHPRRLTALSVGLSHSAQRVVLPPEIEDPPITLLNHLRALATELVDILGRGAAIAGLDAWVPTAKLRP